jgi:predicted lipoprotein with Yx(FWY)xxD motif
MKNLKLLFSLVVPTLLLILAACGTSSTANTSATPTKTTAPTPTATPTVPGALVQTALETIGGKSVTALTNDKGWTLYYFTPDTATTSACTDATCTKTWPPYLSDGTPTSASKLPGQFGVQTNANGSQATYNGHPLYTYAKDTGPGQTNGEGVGGKWHVATTDLAAISGGAIQTTTETIGNKSVTALTAADGWTLYYFTDDTATTSACTSATCTAKWPPYLSTDGKATSTANLPGKLDVLTNANGSQITYNGHLLYKYSGDTGPGQTNGEGVGGKWHVATTDLAAISGGEPTPTPDNGGYNY